MILNMPNKGYWMKGMLRVSLEAKTIIDFNSCFFSYGFTMTHGCIRSDITYFSTLPLSHLIITHGAIPPLLVNDVICERYVII